jgi:hypothetical protein
MMRARASTRLIAAHLLCGAGLIAFARFHASGNGRDAHARHERVLAGALGARHLLQALVLARAATTARLRVVAAFDGLHGLSMVMIALIEPAWRAPASASAVAAGCLCSWDLACSSRLLQISAARV